MFRLLTCIFVCILTCEMPVSIGTFYPSPTFPYHHSLNRNTNVAAKTHNKTNYPLNITIDHHKYSVLLPTQSSSNLSNALQSGFNVTSSVFKPVDNNTRESRHLLHHLFHGLSHGGIRAASGSVSAIHSFNLFGKQINYAMGLSYGKPYYHVVSEVPGPYPYPNPNPNPNPPPETTTETPDGSDGDDNDDNNNDGGDGDDSNDSDGGDDNDNGSDGDGDDDDDNGGDDDDSDNASVSNYSKKSGEQSGCGKRRGNGHGCNASGSYENLTNKKKKKKIRKGTEKPVKDATRKKKPNNKPEKIEEKNHKRRPTTEEKPLGNRKLSRNGVNVKDEFEMPSTLWELLNNSGRRSKDIHLPEPQGSSSPNLLTAEKLRQLAKISKISM